MVALNGAQRWYEGKVNKKRGKEKDMRIKKEWDNDRDIQMRRRKIKGEEKRETYGIKVYDITIET